MNPFVEGFAGELAKVAEDELEERPSRLRGALIGAGAGGAGGVALGAAAHQQMETANNAFEAALDDILGGVRRVRPRRFPNSPLLRSLTSAPAIATGLAGAGLGASIGWEIQKHRAKLHDEKILDELRASAHRRKHAGALENLATPESPDEIPSIGRGAAIGSIIGGTAGLVGGGAHFLRTHPHTASETLLALLGFPAMMGAVGAGMGAGVQAARRLIHQAPETKTAGLIGSALKGTGRFLVKHPVLSLLGLYPAARAAGGAYSKSLGASGTEDEHVLSARPGRPSPYHSVNFHELFPHKLQPWEKFKLSRNYPAWRKQIGASSPQEGQARQ